MYKVAWGIINLFNSGYSELFSPVLCWSNCRLSKESGSFHWALALCVTAGRFVGDSWKIHPKESNMSEVTNPADKPQIPSVQKLQDCSCCPAEQHHCWWGPLQEAAAVQGMLWGPSFIKPRSCKKGFSTPCYRSCWFCSSEACVLLLVKVIAKCSSCKTLQPGFFSVWVFLECLHCDGLDNSDTYLSF